MGINLRWFDSTETTILFTFDGNWSPDEFQTMVIHLRDMVQSKDHIVAVIADLSNSARPSSTMLAHIPFAMRQMQANQGVIVVLTQNDFIKHLTMTAGSLHPALRQRLYVVDSLNKAERILAHHQKKQGARL